MPDRANVLILNLTLHFAQKPKHIPPSPQVRVQSFTQFNPRSIRKKSRYSLMVFCLQKYMNKASQETEWFPHFCFSQFGFFFSNPQG